MPCCLLCEYESDENIDILIHLNTHESIKGLVREYANTKARINRERDNKERVDKERADKERANENNGKDNGKDSSDDNSDDNGENNGKDSSDDNGSDIGSDKCKTTLLPHDNLRLSYVKCIRDINDTSVIKSAWRDEIIQNLSDAVNDGKSAITLKNISETDCTDIRVWLKDIKLAAVATSDEFKSIKVFTNYTAICYSMSIIIEIE